MFLDFLHNQVQKKLMHPASARTFSWIPLGSRHTQPTFYFKYENNKSLVVFKLCWFKTFINLKKNRQLECESKKWTTFTKVFLSKKHRFKNSKTFLLSLNTSVCIISLNWVLQIISTVNSSIISNSFS